MSVEIVRIDSAVAEQWLTERGWEKTDPRGLYSKTFLLGPIAMREKAGYAIQMQIEAENARIQ